QGSGPGPLNVPIAENANIVCTITNTRDTDTSEVRKAPSPTRDPGKFNLQVDGTTRASDAGNGGTTGAITVNTGPNHSVGELAGTSDRKSVVKGKSADPGNGCADKRGAGTGRRGHRAA